MNIQPPFLGVMLLRSLFFSNQCIFFIDNLESFLVFLFNIPFTNRKIGLSIFTRLHIGDQIRNSKQ